MVKDLIIFGAGASHGSEDVNFWDGSALIKKVPALGCDLFDDLQRFDPKGWGMIDGKLAAEFNKDFEKGMQFLSNGDSFQMPPLQRVMADYFFRFLPGKQNLYIKLAERIKNTKWDGVLVTFNYERLLEISLCHVGLKVLCCLSQQELDAQKTGETELCLPHGCCHLFCSVKGHGVSFSKGVCTSGKILPINNFPEFLNRIKTDSFPPTMSYFEPQKQTATGVNFINQQRNRMKELVKEAENIVIIGIRVREHDVHIWDPLKKTDAKIIYCSGKESGEEFNVWRCKYRRDKCDVVINDFFNSSSLNGICDYLDL